MSKQQQVEDEMCSRGYDSRQRKVQQNISKGKESENDYARNMTVAGLLPLSKAIQQFIDRSWRGTPGPKAVAAVKLSEFPDIDVVSFIAIKGIFDGASQIKTATQTAIQIGHLLEDELRFSVFEQEDEKHFSNVRKHIADTAHPRYRRNMMIGHMRNRGFVFKSWSKEDKLRVGMKLIDLTIYSVGMVKIAYIRSGKIMKTYIEFTKSAMDWIKKQRKNRFASYPIYMPCLERPKDYIKATDSGYHSQRLRHVKAIKSKDLDYLEEVTERKPTAFFAALNALQGTKWETNINVLEIAQSCWDRGIEVGCLIDAETLPLPPKPHDIDTNEDEKLKWRKAASLIHDQNAHDRAKRFQCLSLLDTALYYKEETFFHVVQADFTGRIYYAASVFNPQGNDLARALHRFAEGKAIKNEEAKNWLGIAGANNWGMSRCSYQERIEWANTEGAALARQIASSPEATVSLWSKAEEPFQFVAWCIEWNGMLDEGYGFISKHPVLLDGSNNGYQHFAAMTCDQELAGKVNLIKSDKIQDLYNEVKAELLLNLADSEDPLATDWLKYQEVITRKLVKKPIMMIPYSGTLYGISHAIEDYLYHQNLQLDWMTDDFAHNYFLAKKIVETVKKVCPKSSIIMQYLTDVAKCFGGESKIMKWNTPSKFYVNQNYYKLNSKRVKTKIGTSTVRLSLTDVSSEVDKRKTSISFASNFVHSLDAANVHLALHKSKQKGLTNFTTIHDCFGSTAADIQEFISCVKESFVEMYTDNLLDDLYDQAVEQLDKPQRLPIPPILGDFNICEVLLAPYVFS